MKFFTRTLVLIVMLGAVTPAWSAGGLDLSLSQNTANFALQLNPYSTVRPGGGAEVSIGVLFNETGDSLYHATMLTRGVRQLDASQYKLAAGVKAIGGDLEVDEQVAAIALGFQGAMLVSPSRYNPIELIVEGFYAPSISSFTDATKFSELGARLQVDIIPQARAFVGYRRMLFDTNDYKDIELDHSVHVGLNLTF